MLAFVLAALGGVLTLSATKSAVVTSMGAAGADQAFQRRNLERDDALGFSQSRKKFREEEDARFAKLGAEAGLPPPPRRDELEEVSVYEVPLSLEKPRFKAGWYVLQFHEWEKLAEALISDSPTYDYEWTAELSRRRTLDPHIAVHLAALPPPRA